MLPPSFFMQKLFMRFLYCTLILLVAETIYPFTWKKVLEKNGIEVYRKVPSTQGLYEFRARGVIDASIERVMSLIQNVYYMKDWVSGVSESKMLYRNFNNQSYDLPLEKMFTILYARVKLKWPVKDRDFVLKAKVRKVENGLRVDLRPTIFRKYPKKSDAIRMKRIHIEVYLFRIKNNRTWIDYRIFADPAGVIPTFLVNLLIPRESYKTILGLRKLVKTAPRFYAMEKLIRVKLGFEENSKQ
ncbi:MAG: hypothetical protein D6767_00860 [Candidatus Hydrogenedentota bacterium]|nr:MAG: hypothetical protein D6767_00860 [Candidatus Hydrogenedentota bacterium]